MQHIYTVLTFFRAAMNPCYFLPWLFISKVSWRIQLFKSCSAYKRCQGKKRERNHLFTAQICLKATFYHTHMCELTHVWFASWWSLGFYPALCSIFLSFPSPPLSVFFLVAADWQIEAEVSPGPPSPAALCDPLFSACLCWYGRVTSGASCWKPYTMTQKWTLPVVQEETVKENTCDQTLTKKKIKLEAERGVVASRATEQAEMGMLLLIEYKLVFNKTHFTMFAVYWPTLKSTC